MNPITRMKPIAALVALLALTWACLFYLGCSRQPASAKAATSSTGNAATNPATPKATADRTFRILHIMSYHTPWQWTQDMLSGFRESLAGAKVEYRVFEMDAKRQSSPEHKAQAGREACALIESWKPDLVFTSDDTVHEYVTPKYLNSDLPIVFCGVNADPEKYGFDQASNVTGCLEREHFVATVRLLQQLVPTVRKIGVVLDEEPSWATVSTRIRKQAAELSDVQFTWETPHTFAEYQALMQRYAKEMDAVLEVGIFTFKDANGQNVPYQTVQRWTAENIRLPDCSFWFDRVSYGTLCSVTVAAREQGRTAGQMAWEILVNGKRPADIPIRSTIKGEPCISLRRAHALGLKPNSNTLLSSRVIDRYKWEE